MNVCMRRGEWGPSADLRKRPGVSTREGRETSGRPGGAEELGGGLRCGALVGGTGSEAGDRLGGRNSRSVGL